MSTSYVDHPKYCLYFLTVSPPDHLGNIQITKQLNYLDVHPFCFMIPLGTTCLLLHIAVANFKSDFKNNVEMLGLWLSWLDLKSLFKARDN